MGEQWSVRTCPACGNTGYTRALACPRDGTPLMEDRQDPWLGRILEDRYRIIEPLGFGGMGVVYRAKHLRLGTDVAIKIVDVTGRDPSLVRRLEREARAVALIGHENIVSVVDFGRTNDGSAFLVMQLLVGETIAGRIERSGTMSLAASCHVLIQVAYALEAAHECGVVHRDIKPANVFLARERERSDVVKVLDFGIASLEAPFEGTQREPLSGSCVFGTPEYVAPERLRLGHTVDQRADIYSMGVTLYEMLSGNPPFRGNSPIETVLAALEGELTPIGKRVPNLPLREHVEGLLAELLARDPDNRLPSMRQLRIRLVQLRRQLHEPTRRRADLISEEPWTRRQPLSGWVTTSGNTTVVELAGVLDHRSDLESIDQRIVGPEVAIKAGQIVRVNSVGYQIWTDWVGGLVKRGYSVSFHECSLAMIRQANLTPSFLHQLPILSFHAPFYCTGCGFERLFLFQSEHLRTHPFPPVPCESCGSTMVLDDVEETFLLFLQRPQLEA